MQYEATIQFEVRDETVDLTELLAGGTIDLHGVGLVGRTDEGEVASGMQMRSAGAVDRAPEAKVRIAQATYDQAAAGCRRETFSVASPERDRLDRDE